MEPREKSDAAFRKTYDLQAESLWWYNFTVLDDMEKQHHFHAAVQEGNFDGRMCAWEFFLPFHFSTNKHNYGRYDSWYVHQMRNRDSLHSDSKIIFSFQVQARYNFQTTVDQRGEKSLNKDEV